MRKEIEYEQVRCQGGPKDGITVEVPVGTPYHFAETLSDEPPLISDDNAQVDDQVLQRHTYERVRKGNAPDIFVYKENDQ